MVGNKISASIRGKIVQIAAQHPHRRGLARTALALICLAPACTTRADGDTADDDTELTRGEPEQRSDAALSGLEMQAIAPARAAATTDGQRHFVYELALRNAGPAPLDLTRVQVFPSEQPREPLLDAEGEALRALLRIINPDGTTEGILPGGFAFAHFALIPPASEPLPTELRHQLTLASDATPITVAGPSVQLIDDPGEPLGPPLLGDDLLDVNGCCSGGHSLAVLATPDGLFAAQRHAIDFVRLRGPTTFQGDPTDNRSYFLYGAEVLATQDGTIAATSDGAPDRVPGQPLPPFDPQTAAGNHVIQALPSGAFVLYAHLQPSSLRVKPGDEVRRGQVLGLVGNTGNSTEPHLHFQVMDAPSPLVADGLPFTFEQFRLVGRVDLGAGSLVATPVREPVERREELPMAGDVVSFP